MQIAMSRGGRAWRGYFPVGRELTSGKPDRKEGLYFGAELPVDHPAVRAGTPLHGPNLFPAIPGFRETVLRYLDSLTALGHALMSGISLGLGLDEHYFQQRYYSRPAHPVSHLQLSACECAAKRRDRLGRRRTHRLRAAHHSAAGRHRWPAGEIALTLDRCAADSGILSLQHRRHARTSDARDLSLDSASRDQHVAARSAVVSVLLRSEFRCADAAGRRPCRTTLSRTIPRERWDHASVHDFSGTYGEYLLNKVSKVFPELRNEVL